MTVKEKDLKTKTEEGKYIFDYWNVAMAMIHIDPYNRGDIFPEAELLKPEDLYPTHLIYS